MLTHPTLDQLRALKLDGMADAFLELEQQDAARDLTHACQHRLGFGQNPTVGTRTLSVMRGTELSR